MPRSILSIKLHTERSVQGALTNAPSQTSLTHTNAELQKTRSTKLLVWQQSKSQEREDTVQGFYVPSAKSSINPTPSEALKKHAIRFYQLKTGHGAVGNFLTRMGVMETPERRWCGTQEQTVIHLYTECLIRELG